MATPLGDCTSPNTLPVSPTQISGGNCTPAGCSPQQSLPQPLNGITVSPDNVMWIPGLADAPCMQAIGITTLSDWLIWVEQNVISAFCSINSAPCQIGVSQTATDGSIEVVGKTIGAAIADCLGMDANKPHILYDDATGTAIATLIETPEPDCAAFTTQLQTCPTLAPTGVTPDMFVGYTADAGGVIVKRYQANVDQPSRFFGRLDIAQDQNRFTGVAVDTRYIPQGMSTIYNDQGNDNNTPGSSMAYVIGTDGFYDISASLMINTEYTARSGWINTWMFGVVVVNTSGSSTEYRLDEKPLYLGFSTPSGQDITLTGSIGLDLKAGETIQIRAWRNDTTLSGNGYTVTAWFNRSATTHLSVVRRVDQSVVISG